MGSASNMFIKISNMPKPTHDSKIVNEEGKNLDGMENFGAEWT